jgi:hypothetical protein
MTENLRPTLDQIIRNNEIIGDVPVKKVLILYEEDTPYLGDACRHFGHLRLLRSHFNNAFIQLNFQPAKNCKFGLAVLKNDPCMDRLSILEWKDIDLSQYDIIYSISYAEDAFLQFLHDKYGDKIRNENYKPAVFSLSKHTLDPKSQPRSIFPEHSGLGKDVGMPSPDELYISDEERDWADNWLVSKGVKKSDELFICCDSASARFKLLNIDVYFGFLKFLLEQSRGKILLFDERGIGKVEFYRSWLGERVKDRLIVSEKLSLREDICLLGSRSTRLIFGPCTGLMHCASGVYSHYVNRGMSVSEVPLIVTYTGIYNIHDQNASYWWGNSPLVQCLLLKDIDGKKRMRLLSELSAQERKLNDSLPCSEYTTQMLVNFVSSFFSRIRNEKCGYY